MRATSSWIAARTMSRHVTMKTEVNDFDPVPDEFEVDRVDRAVMPVANRHRGENSNRCGHRV